MAAAAVGLALALGGCVYYNGVYNARRLAGLAEKADRDGRTFDASGYWGQVAVKAESVVVRHPDSKWVEEALVLRGQALARLRQCASAVAPLRRALAVTTDPDRIERARLVYGECQLELGDPAGAAANLAPIASSRVPSRRRSARLLYARALRLSGHADEAIPLLADAGPSAGGDRMIVLAEAGQSAAALAVADSFLARKDTLAPWDTLLATLGRSDPRAASELLDRLDSIGSPARHARWLLEDAGRLSAVDSARARSRLVAAAAAADAGAVPDVRAEAEMAKASLTLSEARDVAGLAVADDSLAAAAEQGALPSARTAELRATVAEIRAADSLEPGAPQADLRLFLAAEASRERLGNSAIASALLRRLIDRMPDSPYAPKALLALATLDSAAADTTRALLETRYGASPYVAALRGDVSDDYRALEDSLGTFAAALAATATDIAGETADGAPRSRRPRRVVGSTPAVTSADSAAAPGERGARRPTLGGQRVGVEP
jgi:hypothetical protein